MYIPIWDVSITHTQAPPSDFKPRPQQSVTLRKKEMILGSGFYILNDFISFSPCVYNCVTYSECEQFHKKQNNAFQHHTAVYI